MLDKFPCLRIKRRRRNGQTDEIEIRPSLIRWLLILLVVLVVIIRGDDPARLLKDLLQVSSDQVVSMWRSTIGAIKPGTNSPVGSTAVGLGPVMVLEESRSGLDPSRAATGPTRRCRAHPTEFASPRRRPHRPCRLCQLCPSLATARPPATRRPEPPKLSFLGAELPGFVEHKAPSEDARTPHAGSHFFQHLSAGASNTTTAPP